MENYFNSLKILLPNYQIPLVIFFTALINVSYNNENVTSVNTNTPITLNKANFLISVS